MGRLVDIKEIVAMLTGRAADLCDALGLRDYRKGGRGRDRDLIALNPTRNDNRPGSFRICLDGARKGVWADFSTDDKGDALDLVAYILFAGNKAEALKWSRAWLGIDNDEEALHRAREEIRRHKESQIAAEVARADEADDTRAAAWRIWIAAQERLAGTPVAAYLAGRGTPLEALGRQPRVLRYHPRLWSTETNSHHPAMVAAVTNAAGDVIAVHRTYLQIRPDRTVVKAPLEDVKLTLGSYKGGCIRLWRGSSGKSWRDAPAEPVAITEGIEDGLTVAYAMPELRVLVAIAVNNFANIALPAQLHTVFCCVHRDGDNPGSAKAIEKAVARWRAEDRQARLVWSPVGKDLNDLLRSVPRPAPAEQSAC